MNQTDPVDAPRGTIVHIGAGRGRDLDSHLSKGAARIVLVDADAHSVTGLKRLAASIASDEDRPVSVDVVEAAVAGRDAEAELRIYNLERVSGIRQATGLLEHYPGLRPVRRTSVKTLQAAKLVERLGLDSNAENTLIIEAPGEERAILSSLDQHGWLSAFAEIVITAPVAGLYESSATPDELVELLKAAGYYVHADGGHPWQVLSARTQRWIGDIREIDRLVFELETARASLQSLEEREAERLEITARLEKVDAARAAHEQSVIELSRDNTNLKAKVDEQTRQIAKLEESQTDISDRKLLFEGELSRCEAQVETLRYLLMTNRGT